MHYTMNMDFDQELYFGIDPGAVPGRTRRSFTYAALDADRRLVALGRGEPARAVVAINGPACLNRGLQPQLPTLQSNGGGRSTRMRQVESDLRARGLHIPLTPSALEDCPHWMSACLHLHQQLLAGGYAPYPDGAALRQVLETQTEAVFSAWTGSAIALTAGSLEGRLQRQTALYEQRLPVSDPMDFFEEITRHRLLHGILPMDKLHTHLELNALASAAVAWLAAHYPEKLHPSGDPVEGVIYY
jgi:hypothetical protein